jgi:outer membrane protein assembly factor BamA
MKKHLPVLFAGFFLMFSLPVGSDPLVLKEINIQGLTKTRESTVLSLTGLQIGQEINEDSLDQIRQNLLEPGIFRSTMDISLTDEGDGTGSVNLVLEDRWTFIPLPVGFVSSDSWMAGAVLIESNLLGLNQTVVAGAFAAPDKVFGFSAWNNPRFLGSPYRLSLGGNFFFGDKEYVGADGETVLAGLNGQEVSLSAGLGRSYAGGFSWRADSGGQYLASRDGFGALVHVAEDGQFFWKSAVGISWENIRYTGLFTQGPSLRTEVEYLKDTAGPDSQIKLSGRATSNFLLPRDILLRFAGTEAYSPDLLPVSPLETGGMEGSRAYSSGDLAARSYLNGAATLEIPLYRPGWGSLTLPVFYEGGLVNSAFDQETVRYHGPGFGLRIYLDKVAIPALGADFVWDLENRRFKVNVALGGTGPM